LRATGTPIYSGKQSRVWEVNVHNGEGSLVATGRVRLHVIEAGSKLGGQDATLDRKA
jgi:acyl-coenzyme A thioesterase PaaI-like protein